MCAKRLLSASSYVVRRGDTFRGARKFGDKQVLAFGKLTGDNNAIHSDLAAAKAAGFERQVVPGLLCASLFPAIIARQFPGALYLTQTLQFRKHVLVGTTLFGEVTTTQVHGKHVKFDTSCKDGEGHVVVEGVALARL